MESYFRRRTQNKIRHAFGDYLKTTPKELSSISDTHNKILDIAERHGAGTGSVGLKRYYVLIAGDTSHAYDDLILDVKQQEQPTAFSYLSDEEIKEYEYNFENHAHRLWAYKALLSFRSKPGLAELMATLLCQVSNDFPTETLVKPKTYFQMASQWAIIRQQTSPCC